MKNYNKRITTSFASLMLDPDEGDRLAEQQLKLYDGGAADDVDPAEAEPQAPKSKQERMNEKYADDLAAFDVKTKSGIENGIVRDRGCRDIMCLIVFLTFIGAMLGCTIYSWKNGDPARMMAPYDRNNVFCGIPNGRDSVNAQFPVLYIPQLPDASNARGLFKEAVCVKSCPKAKGETLQCAPAYASSSDCTTPSKYKTMKVGGYCYPILSDAAEKENFKQGILRMLSQNFWGQQLIQIYNCSTAVSVSLVMGIVYSLAYIYLMSAIGEYLAWAVVVLVWLGLAGCTGAATLAAVSPETVGAPESMKGAAYAGMIVFGILFLIYNVMLYCGFRQLKLAVDAIDAAADFIRDTKRLVAVNFLYFIISFIVVLAWVGAVICCNSMGEIVPNGNSHYPQDRSYKGTGAAHWKEIMLFMFFGLLWIVNFISAKTTLITMTSASTYYFNSNEDANGEAEVGWSIKTTYAYHIGTLAFGSFCIAVI